MGEAQDGKVRRYEYSPPWAKHVVALIDEESFDPGTHLREEQKIDGSCSKCGDTFHRTCATGNVREHVHRFATMHLHSDPLAGRRAP